MGFGLTVGFSVGLDLVGFFVGLDLSFSGFSNTG